MKEKVQNISIDVNVEELLEQVETEYLLHELSRRPLLYVDIISFLKTMKLMKGSDERESTKYINRCENISIDVNVEELLEQVETEYLLHELSRRPLLYVDIISLIWATLDEDELKILKKEIRQMIKEKQ
ncbi:hypothetical protein FPY52_05995 [Campylobacter coli]|nr:hypothetical protein [Campylobacter coli]